MNEEELIKSIQGCRHNDRGSQKKIYASFYALAMSICFRYVDNKEDAMEIVNDGFLKIFKQLYYYKATYADATASFSGWLKKIMIHTSIDHYRKNKKLELFEELKTGYEFVSDNDESILDKLTHDEILKAVQTLPTGYRLVFNLYAIDGLTHKEVAEELNIAEGTSKSNLAKARHFLQKKLIPHSL
jgi:RNA polymerase sigma-70 factor (ECF subfamily)